MSHHTWLIVGFLVEMRFHHIGLVGLELLTSSDPPTMAFQSTGITGVNYHAWPKGWFIISYRTMTAALECRQVCDNFGKCTIKIERKKLPRPFRKINVSINIKQKRN